MSDYEKYSASNIDAFTFSDPQQETDVIKEALEQQALKASNQQQFSGIYVNRAFGGKSAIVRMNSLFGSTANADQQYIATQYAAAFPAQAYLSLDLPAHGASDRLTKEQRKDITNSNGSIRTISNAQVESVLDLVPDLDNITLTGEALGSLFATEFAVQAAAKGVAVRQLFGIDPLGMEDRNPGALASSYLFNAQKNRNQDKNESHDAGEQALEDSFSKDFVAKVAAYGSTKKATQAGHVGLMARERTVVRLMLHKSPITRETGMKSLVRALEITPELRADMLFASKSVIGRLTDTVREDLEALSQQHSAQVNYDEWPDDNQNIGLARNQPRIITYQRDVLSSR